MIEEAAGTKTYDLKKANALQTIEKKNSKLNEIERVLREDITPVIEKLKQERSAYIEYQKCEREFLHLHKITTAYQFYQNEQIVNKNKSETNDIENKFSSKQNRLNELHVCIDNLKAEIAELLRVLKETENEATTQNIEAELKQNRIQNTKLKSDLNHLKSSCHADTKKINQLQKNITDVSNLLI
jgi:structural maintenance of chromosome 2